MLIWASLSLSWYFQCNISCVIITPSVLLVCNILFAGDADRLWTVEEASKNLAVPLQDKEANNEKPQWRTRLKGCARFDKKLTNLELEPKPVYDTRHDLSFHTPTGRTVRCKVKRKSTLNWNIAIWLYCSGNTLFCNYWNSLPGSVVTATDKPKRLLNILMLEILFQMIVCLWFLEEGKVLFPSFFMTTHASDETPFCSDKIFLNYLNKKCWRHYIPFFISTLHEYFHRYLISTSKQGVYRCWHWVLIEILYS